MEIDVAKFRPVRTHAHRFATGAVWLVAIVILVFDWPTFQFWLSSVDGLAGTLTNIKMPEWAWGLLGVVAGILIPYCLGLVFTPIGYWLLNRLHARQTGGASMTSRFGFWLLQRKLGRSVRGSRMVAWLLAERGEWQEEFERQHHLFIEADTAVCVWAQLDQVRLGFAEHFQALEIVAPRLGRILSERHSDIMFRGALILPSAVIVGWLANLALLHVASMQSTGRVVASLVVGLIVFAVASSSLNLALTRLLGCLDLTLVVKLKGKQ